MFCLKFSEPDWFKVYKSSRIYLIESTFVNTWREKWVWAEIMIIGVLWVTPFYWIPPWNYHWRPPCTYHWRPHERIIGDPPCTYHWRPPDARWRLQIFIGDPRFSLETPNFLYKWMKVSNSSLRWRISSQTWKKLLFF